MKILLTGTDGNFGTRFRARNEYLVHGVGRKDWDVLDEVMAGGVDAVVHAASDLSEDGLKYKPQGWVDSNVMSTARLLEAAARHRVGRVVFLSTCAVYGDTMSTAEDSPCGPISVNGIGKLLNERIVAEFCQAHAIDCQILRIFNMYGGQDHFSIVSRLARAADGHGEFVLRNAGIAQRDFIHVDDVASIVSTVLRRPGTPRYLNVGTGVATRIADIVDLAQARFPQMAVRHATAAVREAEYSRADIRRLRELVDIDFVRIDDYVRSGFSLPANP